MRVLQSTKLVGRLARTRTVKVRAAAESAADLYAAMTTGGKAGAAKAAASSAAAATATKVVAAPAAATLQVTAAAAVSAGPAVVEAAASSADAFSGAAATAAAAGAAAASSGLDFSDPTVILVAGGAALVAALGLAFAARPRFDEDEDTLSASGTIRLYQPKNAVIVFGAGGRTGRQVVKQLLESGRDVIAAVRDADRAKKVLVEELGLREGGPKKGRGGFVIRGSVDVTNAETLTEELFSGATQVALCVGAVFGRREDGSMGYIDNMTSERVDQGGNANVAAAAKKFLPALTRSDFVAVPVTGEEEAAAWERIDDVIMGGKSSSALRAATEADGFTGAVFEGELIVEGGGFAGTRTGLGLDDTVGDAFKGTDGIKIRVRSDKSQSFKLVVKTDPIIEADKAKDIEAKKKGGRRYQAYQALVDTVAGQWTELYVPWREFQPVAWASNAFDPTVPRIDPAAVQIRKVGFIYSKFEYNGFINPNHVPGPFKFEFEGGISAFKAPKPQILMVSSAATERNARIGADDVARVKDVPIVQLNPGGVLNYKYAGENAVRASGLPYAVLRPTGIVQVDDTKDASDLPPLEFLQGDEVSGKIGRVELAAVTTFLLNSDSGINKSFEVRRAEFPVESDPLLATRRTTAARLERSMLSLVEDRRRTKVGLAPLPPYCPPPPPVTEARRAEILGLPMVQASLAAGGGNRTRDEKEIKAAPKAAAPAAAPAAASGSSEVPANVAEAKQWVANWRSKSIKAAAYGKPADDKGTTVPAPAAAAAPAIEQPPAKEWIAAWRAKSPAPAAKAAPAPAAATPSIEQPPAKEWIAAWRSKSAPAKKAAPQPAAASGSVPENVAEARAWIASWRAQLKAKNLVNV